MSNDETVTRIIQAIGAVGTFLVGLGALRATRQFQRWTRQQREPGPLLAGGHIRVVDEGEKGRMSVCIVLFNPGDVPISLNRVQADVLLARGVRTFRKEYGGGEESAAVPPHGTLAVGMPPRDVEFAADGCVGDAVSFTGLVAYYTGTGEALAGIGNQRIPWSGKLGEGKATAWIVSETSESMTWIGKTVRRIRFAVGKRKFARDYRRTIETLQAMRKGEPPPETRFRKR